MTLDVRPLAESDLDEAWALGLTAFGGEPGTPRRDAPHRQQWGAFEGGRLLGKASLLRYAQWFGGRPVPMAGVAGVAVRPEARGRGVSRALVRALAASAVAQGLPVSALFPTAPGVYRGLGWEVVGSLDETRLAVSDLARLPPVPGVRLRPAGEADGPALQELWNDAASAGNGQLTRTGPLFAGGAAAEALEAEVVTLAEVGTAAVGYLSYDRGRGYGPDSALRVWEMVARTDLAARALLGTLGAWDTVVGGVHWRGDTGDLALLLDRVVPRPYETRPWSLRLLDPDAAVAARGWSADAEAAFVLLDPEAAGTGGQPERAVRLVVRGGDGRLEPADPAGLPRLHVRGLAVLFAGGASTVRLQRTGLLDGPLPALDAAFAGPAPVLLDYF